MSSKGFVEYYEMSEKQFKELERFYEELGLKDDQIKRLSRKCFGAEVRITKGNFYSDNWTFYRRREYIASPAEKISGMLKNKFSSMQRSAPVMSSSVMFERAAAPNMVCDMEGAMLGMRSGAVPSMPMPIPSAEPEFNTAETHDAPEHEQLSPLDNPQCIFSANVNTASWSYLRSRIIRRMSIDKSFVRIEEIINSYPYKLDSPGANNIFSISAEKAKCPWNDDSELLFVGLKGKKAEQNVPQNLAFLVDVSGSMDDEWVLVQMSIMAIVSKLKKGDTMSIIAYSDNTSTVVKGLDCGNINKCIDAVMSIDGIGGCTNGSEGLENAYAYLKENYDKDANNRVFIFTDGDFNFGITGEGGLKEFIYKKRETGIYLSIVGYGEHNFKDNKMETLARNGNGNYTFVSNPEDILDQLGEKLVSNLVTIAKDVKISVELNPEFVSRYRLIGYDSRALTQKEFHDTEKAVDGIGSEHTVAALIEMKMGKAKQQYTTRYVQSDNKGKTDEIAFVEIHYKSPDGENLVMTKAITIDELEKAGTQNITAASVLAAFGMLLKDSQYKGNASKELLSSLVDEIDTTERRSNSTHDHISVIRQYLNN